MTRRSPVSAALVRNTARYYWRQRRFVALCRALFLTVVLRHGSELCQECGRRYNDFLWHAPTPLWMELVGHYGGLLCPRCFERKADAAGIRTMWTPMVTCRGHVATTNWWCDPTRDRLLMGDPDPHYADDDLAHVPQGHWGHIAATLEWFDEPYYPAENRAR